MDDLISRQAAIDAICTDGTALERQGQYTMTMSERKQRDADILEALPSAQPEPCATGYVGVEDDYPVSVKQVLNITAETGALVTQMRVRELPRYAQPERKPGHWILREDLYGNTEAKCSECGWETLVNEPGNGLHEVSDLHFCTNCGADLRGDDHGTD